MKRLLSSGLILLLFVMVLCKGMIVRASDDERSNSESSSGLRSPVVINRMQSTFTDITPYGSDLQYQMNCYGESLNKSTTITGSSCLGRFDYHGDVDSYAFTPSVSGTYTLTTSLNYGPYDTDICVFNTNGGIIASDYSSGNANLSVYLTAGQRYFIQVSDGNDCIAYYVLYYTH